MMNTKQYILLALLIAIANGAAGQCCNYFSGFGAGRVNTGSGNSFIGDRPGHHNTIGSLNTFVGHASGYLNTTGSGNVFIGHFSGYNNITGTDNSFFGNASGRHNTTGDKNTFIGHASGHSNATGSGNVFLGYRAGYHEAGSGKLYIANDSTSSPLIWGDFANAMLAFNGSVGIGTTDPAYLLDVAGTLHAEDILTEGVAVTGDFDLTGDFTFSQATRLDVKPTETATAALSITDQGKVGIGTTDPAYLLDLAGTLHAEDILTGGVAVTGHLDLTGDFTFSNAARLDIKPTEVAAAALSITDQGKVGIGTINPTARFTVNGDFTAGDIAVAEVRSDTIHAKGLSVQGMIVAEEFEITMDTWPDYVFEKGYPLPTLEDVEHHITEKGHLQDIPARAEVLENGINIGEMNAKLLQKIEELTLYLIEQHKENKIQRAEIDLLKELNNH